MKQTINVSQFRDSFRGDRQNQFSYEALGAIFDYLEEGNPDSELDPIAVCCEFQEFVDMDDFRNQYGDEYKTIKDVEDRTTVLKLDNGESFVIVQF